MKLEDLGYRPSIARDIMQSNMYMFNIGRVSAEYKNGYIVKTEFGELRANFIGKLRYNNKSNNDLPKVGDWVALSNKNLNCTLICNIFPRFSTLSRQKVGVLGQSQIIATNVDYGLIVVSIEGDFNINRIERYIIICRSGNITPIIVINKVDLIDSIKLDYLIEQVKSRIKNVQLFVISNKSKQGLEQIKNYIKKGKTYCLLGSSGVGKSTLLNNLLEINIMQTGDIRAKDSKGKHITTHRELTVLESGGIIIDNPGMREIGLSEDTKGIDQLFNHILKLAKKCKFNNCNHTGDKGCAIQKAYESGEIDKDSYHNFMKLQKENAYYQTTNIDKKNKAKNLSKKIKKMKKGVLGSKYF